MTPLIDIAKRMGRALDVESLLGIAAKLSNSGAYLISALLTGWFLTPSEQGFFFTLLSFATLTVIVELGLGAVVIQFISHEMAAMDHARDDAARARATSRLRSIGRFAFLWFWTGGALFLLGAGPGGYYFFASLHDGHAVLPWPWISLAVLISLDLAMTPFWTLLEGARRIRSVYGYRTMKALALGIGTWLSLILGLGLWALPVGFVCTLPIAIWPIFANRDFFRLFATTPDNSRVSWRNEMMPLQWRLAVSWVAGYFMNWAITPISLKMFGSAVAGQVGMTWALATGIATISSSVVLVKSSRFGYLVATGQFSELDRFVLRQGMICIMLSFLGAAAVIGADWFAGRMNLHFVNRVLPLDVLSLFLLGSVLQQATLPLAAYLRAFKKEPFMWLSVIGAVLFIFAFVAGGSLGGLKGVAIGYVAISAGVLLPAGALIFARCRRAWTATGPTTNSLSVEGHST